MNDFPLKLPITGQRKSTVIVNRGTIPFQISEQSNVNLQQFFLNPGEVINDSRFTDNLWVSLTVALVQFPVTTPQWNQFVWVPGLVAIEIWAEA